MGRGGEHFYMSDTYKVQPDMITLAKGLGNGAPIGAVLTSDPVASSVQGKIHFNTFGGDPLQSAQALATIETIEQENLIKNALKVGKQLKLGFQEFAKRFPFIGDVRGRGLLIGLELVENLETKEHSPQKTIQLMEYLKNEGVLVGKGGLYGNVIRIAPPLSLTHSEAQEILRAFEKSLDLVQNQSF